MDNKQPNPYYEMMERDYINQDNLIADDAEESLDENSSTETTHTQICPESQANEESHKEEDKCNSLYPCVFYSIVVVGGVLVTFVFLFLLGGI